MPLRLPLVRTVAEVRKPQRAALQARRARAAASAQRRASSFGRTNAINCAHPGASSLHARSNVSVASAPVGNSPAPLASSQLDLAWRRMKRSLERARPRLRLQQEGVSPAAADRAVTTALQPDGEAVL